jgi:hypothetical protein
MQPVAVLHAEFRTELVVSLYSGWIVQLVNASLSWHTHNSSQLLISNGFIRKHFIIVIFEFSCRAHWKPNAQKHSPRFPIFPSDHLTADYGLLHIGHSGL